LRPTRLELKGGVGESGLEKLIKLTLAVLIHQNGGHLAVSEYDLIRAQEGLIPHFTFARDPNTLTFRYKSQDIR
jgi:hypothetical protein